MSALENWREEKQAAYLYQLVAEHEPDLLRKKLFLDLKIAAEKQAEIWAKKIATKERLVYRPDVRTRLVGKLVAIFGVAQIHFILSAMKVRGMSIYAGAATSHPTAAHIERRHKGLNTAGNLR